MNKHDILDIKQFVKSVDLPDIPKHSKNFLGAQPPRFIPLLDKDQSVIVGSQLQAFSKGVDSLTRQTIQNSVLLAQLVAQKKSPANDYLAWYQTYFEVLSRIGWILEESKFNSFDGGSNQSDVHNAVLQLAAGLMGGAGSTAFQIILKTINALQKLGEGTPAIKIFSRETQSQQAAKFQVGVTEQGNDGGLSVSLMAFHLRASATLTKVLFFKNKSGEAHLEYFTAKVGINKYILETIADDILEKVTEYVDGYVRMLEI